ncbi:sensor histidine kinase [Microbacterium sp. P01]|uniref:sensor histidine kinase n=1 Tax=Microbacterium sp. P01 TaxID=3366261 RepID=UPI00366FE3EF
MSSETAPADVAWPKPSWFLRGPLLSSGVMIAASAALITELSVMLIAGEESLGYLGLGLSAFGLLVIFRARWVGLALTTAGGVASALFAAEYVGIWTVTVFSIFLFAKQGRHVLPATAAAASTLYLALVYRDGGQFTAPTALVAATFVVAAAAAGSVVRLQTESWNAARQRATDLAAAQAVELRQAVTDERLRIARDLHDVVGHELAVVNINVGVAEVSLPAEADAARRALRSAREGLQRTLKETQQILDLLRESGAEPDQRSELPLIENVPSLVGRMIAAGALIEAHIDTVLPGLDPDVSAAAYRIVQEALTNAGKYSTGPVRMGISSTDERLLIDVKNETSVSSMGTHVSRIGYGIVGMRERTQSAGGTINITHSGETFRVHVELPTIRSTT